MRYNRLITFVFLFSAGLSGTAHAWLGGHGAGPVLYGVAAFVIVMLIAGELLIGRRGKGAHSRFGDDFKGDYKGSTGPYGDGMRGIGGKTRGSGF